MKKKEPATHDYTQGDWGRNLAFTHVGNGQIGRVSGWGYGVEKGDYLLIPNGAQSARYQVLKIEYKGDPFNEFFADVVFAPYSGVASLFTSPPIEGAQQRNTGVGLGYYSIEDYVEKGESPLSE